MKKEIVFLAMVASLLLSCEEIENGNYHPFVADNEGQVINEYGEKDKNRGTTIQNDTVFTVNGISFKMIKVEGGSFMMGSSNPDENAAQPVHQVTLSTYFISETEVTQELFKAVMRNCPSDFPGQNKPVGKVIRAKATSFVDKLKDLTGFAFNLPTEAQWEYAARGGNKGRGYRFSGSNNCSDVAIYYGDYPQQVASKNPNELGIYDMSGNMQEMCYEAYSDYKSGSLFDPIGSVGENSVFRGGSYSTGKNPCSVFFRSYINYQHGWNDLGFRIVIK